MLPFLKKIADHKISRPARFLTYSRRIAIQSSPSRSCQFPLQRQQQLWFSQQSTEPKSSPLSSHAQEGTKPALEPSAASESSPRPEAVVASDPNELKQIIKDKFGKKENLRWKPGQKLTNSELLQLFNSYSQNNKSHEADQMKKMLQHPLLHVYGFDRREFIKGCKQALLMISESVSSPRFQAFTKGATRSCEESDFLQSVSSPEVFEILKGLTDVTGYVNSFQTHFIGKLVSKFAKVELPTFKITNQNLIFRQLEHVSLGMEVEPIEGKSFSTSEESNLNLVESSHLTNGQSDLSKSLKSSQQALKDLNEMNPDDLLLKISMTICVRCQLTTSFQLDLDDDVPPDWASKSEDEWVYLYFQSCLDDFDWKIVKYVTDSEYQQSIISSLFPDVKLL